MLRTLRKLRDAFNEMLESPNLSKEEHEALVASDDFKYKGEATVTSLAMMSSPMSISVYTNKDNKQLTITEAKQEARILIARNNETQKDKKVNSPSFS